MIAQPRLLCRYHYDPLDRIAGLATTSDAETRLFYQKSRLATQIQAGMQHSILQVDDHLLAQTSHSGKAAEIALLAADGLRSVVHVVGSGQHQAQAYTAYGYQAPTSGLHSLLGFAGERPDPVTGHYLLGNGYRAFNPVLMRFNSPDRLSPFGEGGVNAYVYCQGDPVSFKDPTGHIRIASTSFLFRGVKVGPLTVRLKRLKNTMPVSRDVVSSGNATVSIIKPSQQSLTALPSRLVRPVDKRLSVPAYKKYFLTRDERNAYEQLISERDELRSFGVQHREAVPTEHSIRLPELEQKVDAIYSSVGFIRRNSLSDINPEQALKALRD